MLPATLNGASLLNSSQKQETTFDLGDGHAGIRGHLTAVPEGLPYMVYPVSRFGGFLGQRKEMKAFGLKSLCYSGVRGLNRVWDSGQQPSATDSRYFGYLLYSITALATLSSLAHTPPY